MIPNGLAEIQRYFGNPAKNRGKWERANIVRVSLPFAMTLAWCEGAVIDTVRLHRKVAPDFTRRMGLVWEHAKTHAKNTTPDGWHKPDVIIAHKALEWLHELGLTKWGGGYNYRVKRSNSRELSVHSYGGAWDINPSENAMGTDGNIPDWYVKIWTDPDKDGNHWVWGGKFSHHDPMHMQMCSGY